MSKIVKKWDQPVGMFNLCKESENVYQVEDRTHSCIKLIIDWNKRELSAVGVGYIQKIDYFDTSAETVKEEEL